MYRLLGFLGGLIFQFVFGIKVQVTFFLVWGILNVVFLFLTFFYRFLCRYSINFEVTFAEAMDCCCGMTIIPQTTYKVTTYYSDGSKTKHTQRTSYTFWWGLVEAFVFFLISFVSPVLLLFIIFLYFLVFYRICKGYGQQKMKLILEAKRAYEQKKRNQINQLPNNIFIEKNNELIPIKNLNNCTVEVYTKTTVAPPPSNRLPLMQSNNFPNMYPNGIYPPPPPNHMNSYYSPNMPTYPNGQYNPNLPINYNNQANYYPNPPNNVNNYPNGTGHNNIQYVPMPQPKVNLDSSSRNLVIHT